MKPILFEGKLAVELTMPERAALRRARDIGVLLETLHQTTGAPLVAAVDEILKKDEE